MEVETVTCLGEDDVICDYCCVLLRRDEAIEIVDPTSGHVYHVCGRCLKSKIVFRVLQQVTRMVEEGILP